jgi:hypothetical protein
MSRRGIAATALAVSWVVLAMTMMFSRSPTSPRTSGNSSPTAFPARRSRQDVGGQLKLGE